MSAAPAQPVVVLAVLGEDIRAPTEPLLRADDDGLVRGDGCFEGCRLQIGLDGSATVDKLDRHLARMARSAHSLELAFDAEPWRALVDVAAAEWARRCPAPGEAGVKLLLSRGPVGGPPVGFVRISALPSDYPRQRRDGLRVITLGRGVHSSAFADVPWLLGGTKSLSYAANMAATREAVRRGADDALFVSTDGMVLEAPTASVVWSVGRTLRSTPLGDTGILAGTTQALLFERAAAAGWCTEWTLATVEELRAAEVVWLVSSVRGPVDVVTLDGVQRSRRPGIDAEVRRLAGF